VRSENPTLRRVLFIQPYLADYRVAFYEQLAMKLQSEGYALDVAHGRPGVSQAARGDAGTVRRPWERAVRQVVIPTPFGELIWKRVGRRQVAAADVICAELAIRSLNSWWLSFVHPKRTVLWGHGKPFVAQERRLERRLKAFMGRRVSAVLTYTQEGADYLLEAGVGSSNLHVVGNSTDTANLRASYVSLVRDMSSEEDDMRRRTAVFVGGLDESKRIDFLIAAGEAAHRRSADFRLLVAGEGDQASLVEAALEGESWLVRTGRVTGDGLAQVFSQASCVWMPGRVGLVAVDALAAGLPVLTTRIAGHAPELAFLSEGSEVFFLTDDPNEFAAEALRLMDEGGPRELRDDIPTIEGMVANFNAALTRVAQSRK
jgi:glycosyltransferase involved in cell wall biosynthesis